MTAATLIQGNHLIEVLTVQRFSPFYLHGGTGWYTWRHDTGEGADNPTP